MVFLDSGVGVKEGAAVSVGALIIGAVVAVGEVGVRGGR